MTYPCFWGVSGRGDGCTGSATVAALPAAVACEGDGADGDGVREGAGGANTGLVNGAIVNGASTNFKNVTQWVPVKAPELKLMQSR